MKKEKRYKLAKEISRMQVELLVDIFGEAHRLAELMELEESLITRWLEKGVQPAFQPKVLSLYFVTLRLLEVFLKPVAIEWFQGKNPVWNHARPRDLIRDGRISEVLMEIDRMDAFSFS